MPVLEFQLQFPRAALQLLVHECTRVECMLTLGGLSTLPELYWSIQVLVQVPVHGVYDERDRERHGEEICPIRAPQALQAPEGNDEAFPAHRAADERASQNAIIGYVEGTPTGGFFFA